LFDGIGHPFVPTCILTGCRAQPLSRMPQAPAQPARNASLTAASTAPGWRRSGRRAIVSVWPPGS